MSKGRTTDALDRWTISIDANPRLAGALEDEDTEATTRNPAKLLDAVRAVVSFLGALPQPARGLVFDWLLAGRVITRQMLRDYRISHTRARAMITDSGIEGLLLAIRGDLRGGL